MRVLGRAGAAGRAAAGRAAREAAGMDGRDGGDVLKNGLLGGRHGIGTALVLKKDSL